MADVKRRYFFSSLLLLFFYALLSSCAADRKLRFKSQPGCDIPECKGPGIDNGSFPNVGYIRADGSHDSLHYLITTVDFPTVLVVNTRRHAPDPIIDWRKLLLGDIRGAITFDGVLYSFGVVFTKLYEFNDTDNTGNLTDYGAYNASVWRIHDLSRFNWDKIETLDMPAAITIYANSDMDGNDINKTLSLSFFGRDHVSRDKILPHLLYSENITQVELLLDDFSPSFKKSRFGLEIAVFSSGEGELPEKLNVTKTLDDEHTPGVFQMDNWVTRVPESPQQGFLQWKPVAYAKPKRERNDGRKVISYDLQTVHDNDNDTRSLFNQSFLYAFYQEDLYYNVSLQMMNVSFGLGDDGSYMKTKYIVWTMNLGYGSPPTDTVSTMVIIVICCGLGIPVIFIIFGGTFVFCKKQRIKRRAASGINTSFPVVR